MCVGVGVVVVELKREKACYFSRVCRPTAECSVFVWFAYLLNAEMPPEMYRNPRTLVGGGGGGERETLPDATLPSLK